MSTSKEEWGEGTIALHTGYSPVPLDMTLFRSFVPPIIESSVYPLKASRTAPGSFSTRNRAFTTAG